MKIGIEAQRIFRPDKHGMDFVILEVLRLLQLHDDGNEYFVFVASGQDRCLRNSEHMHIVELHCPIYPLWEQWVLMRAIKQLGIDMLHCTSNTAPLYCSVPLILTLHDIIYLKTAKDKKMSYYQQLGWYYRRWNVRRIVNQCEHIITVSETERNNILQCFPQLESRLSVVHNGYNKCYRKLSYNETKIVTNKYLPDDKYLFFLGNTDPRKNINGVLLAYNEYLKYSERPLKLVISSLKRDFVEAILTEMNIKNCAPYIVYTGYIPSEDMPGLYNGAYAFLYPSLKEGFGIPVLESMACGTPVITSNCSSLPEVAGPGGLMVNPFIPKEIANALLQLESDPIVYNTQTVYGIERAKVFSWQQTAESYQKIYMQLAYKLVQHGRLYHH